MIRRIRGGIAQKRRKKILLNTKSARGSNSRLFSKAQQHTIKAFKYSYCDRRTKKRDNRILCIVRLSTRIRSYEINYSVFTFIKKLSPYYYLSRIVLVCFSLYYPKIFNKIVKTVFKV